jgi:hypothetical protein
MPQKPTYASPCWNGVDRQVAAQLCRIGVRPKPPNRKCISQERLVHLEGSLSQAQRCFRRTCIDHVKYSWKLFALGSSSVKKTMQRATSVRQDSIIYIPKNELSTYSLVYVLQIIVANFALSGNLSANGNQSHARLREPPCQNLVSATHRHRGTP